MPMSACVIAGAGIALLLAVSGPLHARAPAVDAAVRVTTDVDYVPTAEYGGKKDWLDVYAPAGAKGAPVVVSIHGGALREGDKKEQAFVGHLLAKAGFVGIVINYRLSPGVMHPAHVEDAAHAVAWARTHATAYGGIRRSCSSSATRPVPTWRRSLPSIPSTSPRTRCPRRT